MKLNRPSRSWQDHDLNGRLRPERNQAQQATPETALSGTLQAYAPSTTVEEPVEAQIVDAPSSAPFSTYIETEPVEHAVHETQSYEPNPFGADALTAMHDAEVAVDPWTPELPPVAAVPAPVAPPPAPSDDVFALLLDRLRETQAGIEVLLGASIEAVAAARDEVAQHRAHVEAEAVALVEQAHADAERIRADARADVEEARRRLARFSAEIDSLAGELHERHQS